jgi:hypothetical protein
MLVLAVIFLLLTTCLQITSFSYSLPHRKIPPIHFLKRYSSIVSTNQRSLWGRSFVNSRLYADTTDNGPRKLEVRKTRRKKALDWRPAQEKKEEAEKKSELEKKKEGFMKDDIEKLWVLKLHNDDYHSFSEAEHILSSVGCFSFFLPS